MEQTFTYQTFRQRYHWDFSNVKSWLGEGGFGKVYLAEDTVRTRLVAIKVAPVNPNRLKINLLHEFELVKKQLPVDHYNIATYESCHRFETEMGAFDFAVLQYYPDGNLKQLMDKQTLTTAQKADIAAQILEGIEFYQQRGVIHRDLKPENILIAKTSQGRWIPKIGDFGISKAMEEDLQTRIKNSIKGGTLDYAAPEQLKGEFIDFNADLWSYGVLLYYLFTKKLPFRRANQPSNVNNSYLEYLHQLTQVISIDNVQALPEPFLSVVRRCLVVSPSLRAQNVQMLKTLLGKIPPAEDAPNHNDNKINPTKGNGNGSANLLTRHKWVLFLFLGISALGLGWFVNNRLAIERVKEGNEAFRRKDFNKAFERLSPYAQSPKCDAWCQYHLAEMHLQGSGGAPVDTPKAITGYRQSAHLNYSLAQMKLGECYQKGYGVPKDLTKAAGYYEKASRMGNSEASVKLGMLYASGDGVKRNVNKAFELIQAAGIQGNPTGQFTLGFCYENGVKVTKSMDEALRWYQKAANQSNQDALYKLGQLYESGTGVSTDSVKALPYFIQAAELGYLQAQIRLGDKYHNGEGVLQNYQEAFQWILKAAKQGHTTSQSNIGYMYRHGEGIGKDEFEAKKWYQKAAEHGNVSGQKNLGVMYANGYGCTKDMTEAVKWYKKAADQGEAAAQYYLATYYETGDYLPKNLSEAMRLYKLSATNGDADAIAALKRLQNSKSQSQSTSN